MKKEIVPIGTNLPIAAITTDFLQQQTEFVAGAKCRNKAGGPDMNLVAFMPYNAQIYYHQNNETGRIHEGWTGSNVSNKNFKASCYEADFASALTEKQMKNCYLKISLDDDNKYLFHEGLHGGGSLLDESHTRFYCLCKYWSAKDEDFRHVLLLPSELELL